jgi:hypothetical protein
VGLQAGSLEEVWDVSLEDLPVVRQIDVSDRLRPETHFAVGVDDRWPRVVRISRSPDARRSAGQASPPCHRLAMF